ncbi:hypothetical protein SD81_000050 [Tolypothrix campylonemoides VB511288]|nr:hypothetical protein SD81_000050 [Tolypothrix campylonemoides VB511288]
MKVTKAVSQAYDLYKPCNHYSTQITFFRPNESNPEDFLSVAEFSEILKDLAWRWNEFSTEPVDLYFVPGDHVTMMTKPHVLTLTERLQMCIDQVQANSGVK